jgi:hypothetical protein
MTYETFLKITLTLQKADRDIQDLYKKKVDLLEFVEPYHDIIMRLIREVYGEEGADWYSWFCYENDFGQKDWSKIKKFMINGNLEDRESAAEYGAYDEKGNPICYSFESTWEYLENNYNKNGNQIH